MVSRGFLSRTKNILRVGQRGERPEPILPKALGESVKGYKAIPRSTRHMARIVALGCLICRRPAQAHHVDILTLKNMGPKVSDYLTAPLCPDHHTNNQHDCAHVGEREFWIRHGISIGSWINFILCGWYPAGTNENADHAIEVTGGRRAT